MDEDLDTDWYWISFDPPQPPEPIKSTKNVTCPKCGKKLGRGAHFHIKACNK